MNRRACKKLKLQARGTYHRADQWAINQSAKRVWAVCAQFCTAVEHYTGQPCPVAETMQSLGFARDPISGRVRHIEIERLGPGSADQ